MYFKKKSELPCHVLLVACQSSAVSKLVQRFAAFSADAEFLHLCNDGLHVSRFVDAVGAVIDADDFDAVAVLDHLQLLQIFHQLHGNEKGRAISTVSHCKMQAVTAALLLSLFFASPLQIARSNGLSDNPIG